jgi:hypothetical protein
MEDNYSLLGNYTTLFVVRTVTATPVTTKTTVQQELSRPHVQASRRVSIPVDALFKID